MKVKNPLKGLPSVFRRGRNKTARQQSTHFPQPAGISREDLFGDLHAPTDHVIEHKPAIPSDAANRRFRSAPPPQREDVQKFRRKYGRNRFVENSRERSTGSRGRSCSPEVGSGMKAGSSACPVIFEESSSRITRSSSRLVVHSDDEFEFFSAGPIDLSKCPKLPIRARSSAKRLRKGGSGGRDREHAPTPKSSVRSSKNQELSEILGFC